MYSQGYLYGSDCLQHHQYNIAKSFLNKYVSDDLLSLKDSCYYLNNYQHIQIRGTHRYARPSFAFKFILKNNKKYFHKGQMEYCYHGTNPDFLPSIIKHGLKIPDGKICKVVNGTQYGNGIYSTKIPEYAQLYAQSKYYEGKYCQVILLLRQDLKKIEQMGGVDKFGKGTTFSLYNDYPNLQQIHRLHKQLMKQTDIQWMTCDECSVLIQGILIKVNDMKPQQYERKKINDLIGRIK